MRKVSIIIPVYNVRPYIVDCLDSVLNQTYTNLEIICIDDGSNDGTEKILDKYAAVDDRVIVVHQKNKGPGYARNVGLELSTGEYIGFVDGDDWIAPEMYEKLVNLAIEKDVQLVASPYWKVTDLECIYMRNILPVSKEVFGRDELFKYVFNRDCYQGFTSFLWCKLFHREVLLENNQIKIKFDERIILGEDILFFTQAASSIYLSAYTDTACYYYRQRNSSVAHNTSLAVWLHLLEVYERVIDCLKETLVCEEAIDYAKRFQGYWACVIAEKAEDQGELLILAEALDVMEKRKEIYYKTNKKYPDRIEHFNRILTLGKSVMRAKLE